MKDDFADVQRIVLIGGRWKVSQQLVIGAAQPSSLLHFLNRVLEEVPPTSAGETEPALQVSLGFSRRGLEHALVPAYVLAGFAAKAPAFAAGAALRAAIHLGSCGADAPIRWDPAFGFTTLDGVLSLHANTHGELDTAMARIQAIGAAAGLPLVALPRAEWPVRSDGHFYVHFGYRDGLSGIGIAGWNEATQSPDSIKLEPFSTHAAGEFVLGHAQNSGANPWLASGGRIVWPEELRAFFVNGSFGVLHQIQQYVSEFDAFVAQAAKESGLPSETIRAKLCGRTSEGWPVGRATTVDPSADFGYEADDKGEDCPFGAHARRMNPRDSEVAHSRRRPLLRRGMPYGGLSSVEGGDDSEGLMGLFFCASIEDQYEHLLGHWAERVPLGSGDEGGARDPLIGGHEPGDGDFQIPVRDGRTISLGGLRRFTRTRGAAYLFYPSLTTLRCIARNGVFADTAERDAP